MQCVYLQHRRSVRSGHKFTVFQQWKSYIFEFMVRDRPRTPQFIDRGIRYASFQMGLPPSKDPQKMRK